MERAVEKGKFLFSVDTSTDEGDRCFTIIHFFKGIDSGHIYYNYSHSDATYCPLNNYWIEHCKEIYPCEECPQAEYFLELADGEIIPVNRLPLYRNI